MAAENDLYTLGLALDPSSMVKGANESAQALDKVTASAEKAEAASDGVTASAKSQAKAHDDLGEAIEHHHIRLGLLERGLLSFISEMTGASHELLHMGSALTEFATGGEFLVGALAGVTALSAVFEHLTEETDAARKAAEDYAKSPEVQEVLNRQRREAGLPTTGQETAEQVKSALENALAGTSVQGNDMLTTNLRALRELAVAYADGEKSGAEFDQSLKAIGEVAAQLGDETLTKAWNEVRQLGTAFEDASRHAVYHTRVIQIAGMSEKELADYTKHLTEEYAKFGEGVKAAGEQADKSNAQIFGSNLTTSALIENLDQMFKAMHAPIEQMSKMWEDELHKITKDATPEGENWVKGVREGIAHQESQLETALERPFHEAFRSATHDIGSFFEYVVNGGTDAFGHLAQSIKDTFAKLIAALAEQKLAHAIFGADGMAMLGMGTAPGELTGLHGRTLGGLAVAGVGGAVGYSMGGMTGNSAVGGGLGALSGAATGAMMGSVIPGIGTAAGAIIGGTVGLIGGLFGSAAHRQAEEVQRALKEEEESQVRASAHIRELQSEGRSYEAESAQLALQHEQELADARQKGYDSATLAAITLAQAAEDAAQAADQARRKQQDAADAIAQEGSLFGESPAETQAKLAALYGFGGKSRDEILGMYTRYNGGELTPDQQSLNSAIQNYVSQYLQSPGSSTTLSSVSSISAAQSDVVTGLLTSQVMFLSRIATATETLAGTGGMLSPVAGGSARTMDTTLATAAMTRRAAVGAVRGPTA